MAGTGHDAVTDEGWEKKPGAITSFSGAHRFLSNFHQSPVEFEGATYRSVEHAFQAAKAVDPKQREWVAAATEPGQAKYRGRRVTLRPDWDAVKEAVMYQCLSSKFSDLALREALLATGDACLVEGNSWGDVFWGVCKGRGKNRLGVLLMKLREELAAGQPA